MLNFILGFLRIEIRGLNLEKFIGRLLKEKVMIKNLCRPAYNHILFSVPVKDRHKLFDISRKMCYNISVQKISGIAGLAVMLKRKIGLSIGLLCVIVLLAVSNMFVFSVRVYGTKNVSVAQITQFLEMHNIGQFSFKPNIDSAQIERLLIDKFDLSMCSVTTYGGSLIVNIREKLNGV